MRLVKSGLITIVTGVVAAFSAVSSASDEYRLSAFADVSGYAQIKSNNIEEAKEFIVARSGKKMDFLELNNLCVLELLVEDFSSAIEICETALGKSTSTRGIGFGVKKKVEASIHSTSIENSVNFDSPVWKRRAVCEEKNLLFNKEVGSLLALTKMEMQLILFNF